MGTEELLRIMDLPPADLMEWYRLQIAIADRLRVRVNRLFGGHDLSANSPAALPEAADVVEETCQRVLAPYSERYGIARSPLNDFSAAVCGRRAGVSATQNDAICVVKRSYPQG
jgi:hypothetical protein